MSARLNFTWTAPGNDFNHGRAHYYKIYCGYSRQNLSYHHCKSIREHSHTMLERIQYNHSLIEIFLKPLNSKLRLVFSSLRPIAAMIPVFVTGCPVITKWGNYSTFNISKQLW